MSCYHPLLGIPNYENLSDDGKRTYDIIPGANYDPSFKSNYPGAISIPCGHCLGCRLDYSRAWADRMMLELDHYKGKAIFLTLTYNNEHVPITTDEYTGEVGYFTLWKPDLQKFLKRLRKAYPDRVLRFYAAGEYGSKTWRSHYHLILFGIGLEDLSDKIFLKKNDLGQPLYTSPSLQRVWSISHIEKEPRIGKKGQVLKSFDKVRVYEPIGHISFSEVSWKTCAYVSRYVTKKVFAAELPFQDLYGCEPEFSLMSRRPGIGATYMEDHPELFDNTNLYVKGHSEPISIPKYFVKKLMLINPDLADNIKKQRAEYANDKELLKLHEIELSFTEQLEVEENKKLLRTAALRREL